MLNRQAKLVTLTLIATLVSVVACRSNHRGTPACDYSRLRTEANQSALNNDFSRALTIEKLSFQHLIGVEEKLRDRANEESLARLATFAMASGEVAASVKFRRQLVEMLREQENRTHSIKLQEKLLENAKQMANLDAAVQSAVFEGTAAQFQADVYFRNEQPYEAIEKLKHAVEKFDSALGADNLLTALISGRQTDLKLRYGGMPEALEKIEANRRVLAAQLGADHPETIELLTVKATHHEVRADWQPYVECYESYLNRLTEIEPHDKQELIAFAKRQLAFGYSRTVKFALAARYYDESEELVRNIHGEPSVELAQWMFLRADNYLATGEWKAGELLLDISLNNLQQLGDQHSGKWNKPTLNNIRRRQAETIHRQALCALYDENLDKAFKLERGRKAFLRSKAILDDLGLQESIRYVFVLRQLCEVEHLAKRDLQDESASEARARAYIDQACEAYKFICGGEFGPHYRLLQLHRIAMERAWGNYDHSINEFFESVNLDLINPNKAQIATCLREAGLTYSDMGQPAKALEAYANAIDMYGEYFFFDLLSSNESRAAGYAEFSRDCLKDMVAAADKSDIAQVEILFEYVSRIKGMVQRAQAARSQIRRLDDSKRDNLSQKLSTVGKRIFNLIIVKAQNREPNLAIDEQIKRLTREKRDLIAEIGNSISFEEIQFESNIISRLQRYLPGNTTLVEIYRQPESQIVEKNIYHAFVFKKLNDDFELACVELGDADNIDAVVVRLNESASRREGSNQAETEFDSIGKKLRTKTWDLLQPFLGKKETIVVCGDGPLSSVPWCGLPSRLGKDGKDQFLLDEYVIVPATNARDLVDNLATTRSFGEGTLLVGNLDFGLPGEVSLKPTLHTFQRLEESAQELEFLTRRMGPIGEVNILQESEATLARVTNQLPLVRFAHFATHGFFLGTAVDEFKDHSFSQAALALSTANEPCAATDDPRFLSGEQIISMNLTNLEMVVLSACESSRGLEVSGEGSLGIQRAFMLAGAKTCVASQWPVGDSEARKFMEFFYKNLLDKKLSKIASLRQAQIQMHNQGHPPESWANWKLLGDWR